MTFAAVRIPIVCLLTISVGHLPVPWVHRHQGIEDVQLGGHLRIYHGQVAEYELPAGWHVHLLCPGTPGDYPEDGWNPPPARLANLYSAPGPLPFEPEMYRSLERVRGPLQNPIADPLVATGSSRVAALSGSGVGFNCASLRADNDRDRKFCVLLL